MAMRPTAAWSCVGWVLICAVSTAAPAVAATRIKTVEWPLLQSFTTFTSESHVSSPLVIRLPERGVTVRTAYVELNVAASSATMEAGSFIGLRRGGGTGTAVNGDGTAFGAFPPPTGETMRYLLRHNAIRAFTGPDACLAPNTPCVLLITLTGGTKANLSAKLVLTYEYDDTSPTQLKTVRYLAGRRATFLTAGQTQSFSHIVYLPEQSPVILASWYEVRGLVSGGPINLQGLFSLGTWGPVATLALGADRTATDWLFLYQPPAAPAIGLLADNRLLFSAIGADVGALSAEYAMTYQYNFTTSSTFQQTIRRPFGEINSVSSGPQNLTAPVARTITLVVPETNATVRSAYAAIRTTTSGDRSSLLLSVNPSTCSATDVTTYQLGDAGDPRSPTAAAPVVMYTFFDPSTAFPLVSSIELPWDNGRQVSLCPRWAAAGGGSLSMELIYTYEYNDFLIPAGTWTSRTLQTVRYGAPATTTGPHQADAIQDMAATAGPSTFSAALVIPERLVSLRDVAVDVWDTSGATADVYVAISINGIGPDSLSSIVLDNDGTAQLAGRIRCVTGSSGTSAQCPSGALISDVGAFAITVQPTTAEGGSPLHLANAVVYATYLVSTAELTSWTATLPTDAGLSFGAPSLDSLSPIFAADASGRLYALASTTGVLLSTLAAGSVVRAQALTSCCVYAGTANGTVLAFTAPFTATTPALLWSVGVGDGVYARPAVSASTDGDRVLVVTRSTSGLGSVMAMRAVDGGLVSIFSGAADGCTGMGMMGSGNSPVLDSTTNRLYVTSDTRGAGGCSVWALRADLGAVAWRRAGLGSVEAAAAVGHALNSLISSHVYVGASALPNGASATLYALSSVDGTTLYSFSTGCPTVAIGRGCSFVTGLQATPGGAGLASLVFTTSDDRIWHVRDNGTRFTVLWSLTSTDLGSATGLTAPVVSSGRVYVGDAQGRLHRISLVNGAEAAGWPKRLVTVDGYGRTALLGDPVVQTSRRWVIIGTDEGKVYAIYDP